MKLKNYTLLGLGLALCVPAMARNPKASQLPMVPGVSPKAYAVMNKKFLEIERHMQHANGLAAKTTASPQRLIGQASYEWVSGTPQIQDSARITYGGNRGSKFGEYVLHYDLENSADQPGTIEYQDTYVHYDTLEQLTYRSSMPVYQLFWRNYNAAGMVTLSEVEDDSRRVFTYTSGGRLNTVVTEVNNGGGYDAVQREYYVYNATGLIEKDSIEVFDEDSGDWMHAGGYTFRKDANGRIISYEVAYSIAGTSLTVMTQDYTYGNNGKISLIRGKQLDQSSGTLVDAMRDTLGYTGTTMVYEDFSQLNPDDGMMMITYQERRRLNAQGMPDSVAQISTAGGNVTTLRLSYDANNYPTRVTTYEASPTTPASEVRYYYQLIPTSVKTQAEAKALTLAPNPASSQIRLNNAQGGSYRVVDLSGRLMIEGRIGAGGVIGVQTLAPGLYSIQLNDAAGQRFAGRFVKQ